MDSTSPRAEHPFVFTVRLYTPPSDLAWKTPRVSPRETPRDARDTTPTPPPRLRLNPPRNLPTRRPLRPRARRAETPREPLRRALFEGLRDATQYAGMVIVGGAGAYMDLGGNRSVRPLIELIAALGRPVVAICYGVAVLIQATHPSTKMPLVLGRFITGHSEEDDYTDGTTDVPVEGGYGPNYGSATMTLEQMIKQYTGPEGGFLSRNGSPYMAVVDGPS